MDQKPGAGQRYRLSTKTPPFVRPKAWANDTLAYTYDQLGRVATRTLNAVGSVVNGFDGLGRAMSQVNGLGTFTTSYVANTGRVDHGDLGNGQRVQLSYLRVAGDDRLA